MMINGALTIGTYDGANVEMVAETGNENMFIFGLTCNEVEQMWLSGYQSTMFYTGNERLRRAVDALGIGFAGESFRDISSYLLQGHGVADPYMCLADFESYRQAHEKALAVYKNPEEWNRMSLVNIAAAGKFASDRSIEEYAKNIWKLKKI